MKQEEVVARIREFLEVKRMKLAQFTRDIDMNYNHVYDMFKAGKVSSEVLIRMANTYEDADMNYILKGKRMVKWL